MRETKFRSFDGVIMHSWEELLDENMTLKILNSNNKLMQYTGLKDKNGVEIYEGDIVVARQEGYFTVTGVITWDDEGADYEIQDEGNCMRGFGITDAIYEVIGNIYENKELLK